MPRQTVETPIRHSCDRCHSQKLRCTRTGIENTGACIRCQRKHVQCIYSFALPEGRPSVYEPIDADHDPPSTPLPPLTSPPPASPRAIQSQYTDVRSIISEASSSGSDYDVVIGQLSQLSIRLSRLCRLAEELASPSRSSIQPGHERVCVSSEPLIDATAFDSVALWLAHGSTGFSSFESTRSPNGQPTQEPDIKTPGGMLYYLFSASQFMLEILGDLHPNVGAMFTTTIPSPMEFNPFDNVICHLSIGCYSSLMNIYISVLDILEHDAKLSNQADRAVLGDIQLVSIVQICSYLIERQNQAIGLYLSAESSTVSPWQDLMAKSNRPVLQSPDTATREDMRCLEMELQQRLSRLQQILCF
ncbi:hypothetical protein N7517_005062 [Penicillium concentricum]|uniref:Zn(2)-C6 fungal-type domain-containing protein n=1 Tax=Penicillium concentricum TaxID=293559 RepID=A0A9W9S6R4_9EURO|nr:uncharacterized protein N7517_005062 [Penicillium concentricum]KAJ5373056.1 hypothetical protein N7517_005062 [Penicillium concentricum]